MVDEFVTEAVLAKLEERKAVPQNDGQWAGDQELKDLEAKLAVLRQQWTMSQISDGLFFSTVRQVEERIRSLRNDQARHAVAAVRAQSRFTNVRADWYDGKLDMAQKRAYVREALEAVVVLPAGRGRRAFDPDLLQLSWRG